MDNAIYKLFPPLVLTCLSDLVNTVICYTKQLTDIEFFGGNNDCIYMSHNKRDIIPVMLDIFGLNVMSLGSLSYLPELKVI